MAAKFGIFEDKECTKPFTTLGKIDIGETKKIPFYIGNIGTTIIMDIEIENSFEDVEMNIQLPLKLDPGNYIEGYMVWKPKEESSEGKKTGSIKIFGRSVGEPQNDS